MTDHPRRMTKGRWLILLFLLGFGFNLVALAVGLDTSSWQYFVMLAAFATGVVIAARLAPHD